MSRHEFVTVDVFAEHAFEGNQLAVFPDASDIPEDALQAIAREFGFSETTFVLPPEGDGDARVRIVTRDGEAAFAGHPLVGTAAVLAERWGRDELALQVPAGTVHVRVETSEAGLLLATVATPQPLSIEATMPAAAVAHALDLPEAEVVTATHPPTSCGMGRPFVVAEVTASGLTMARPDCAGFTTAREDLGADRFAILTYARTGPDAVKARMFSPLTGTAEDAATGSANVALAGLLLHHDTTRGELRLTSRQGVAMGRPSTLHLHAWRDAHGINASVAGTVVTVTSGHLALP